MHYKFAPVTGTLPCIRFCRHVAHANNMNNNYITELNGGSSLAEAILYFLKSSGLEDAIKDTQLLNKLHAAVCSLVY